MRFWISTEVVYLQRWHGWCYVKLLLSQRILCTPYSHAPCHFMQSHICIIHKVHVYLAVTCHLHFWQNDWGLLRVTAVKWGWNGYWSKSQHRKLTLEKKILMLLLQGFEPTTFQSQVWRSNLWAMKNLHPHNLLKWFLHSCIDNFFLVYRIKVYSWTDSFLYIKGTGSLFLKPE